MWEYSRRLDKCFSRLKGFGNVIKESLVSVILNGREGYLQFNFAKVSNIPDCYAIFWEVKNLKF